MVIKLVNILLLNIRSVGSTLKGFVSYIWDFISFSRIDNNNGFSHSISYSYPCLNDKTTETPIEPIYFLQNTWCAKLLSQAKPSSHYDVGSSALLISVLSQFIPTTMIDIRPLPIQVSNLSFIQGSILSLPFKDKSIKSLSSICVIEHIGLGRYGDIIDPWGTEKAVAELKRVLAKGGNLYITVPVDQKSKVCFNAHRTFTRNHILKLFEGLQLMEEEYIYGSKLYSKYDGKRGFGTGMFHFKKK